MCIFFIKGNKNNVLFMSLQENMYDVSLMSNDANIIHLTIYEKPRIIVPFIMRETWEHRDNKCECFT